MCRNPINRVVLTTFLPESGQPHRSSPIIDRPYIHAQPTTHDVGTSQVLDEQTNEGMVNEGRASVRVVARHDASKQPSPGTANDTVILYNGCSSPFPFAGHHSRTSEASAVVDRVAFMTPAGTTTCVVVVPMMPQPMLVSLLSTKVHQYLTASSRRRQHYQALHSPVC